MSENINDNTNEDIQVSSIVQPEKLIEQSVITHQNPLMQFARKPEIYITLPSNGNFTNPNDFDLSINNELGISSMTTSDELLLKTPDALLNGESLEKIIKSCAPGIKYVRNLPTPDIDAILVGIRMASYGDNMDFSANCPECETLKEFGISLTDALTRIEHLKKEYIVTLSNNVKISLKPYTYESNIKQGLMAYNESLLMKAILNDDLEDPEIEKQYQESFNNMAKLLIELSADSILKIWDPEGNYMDVDSKQIHEWIKNISRGDADLIQKKVNEINDTGVYKKIMLKCDNEECGHEWETEISFDAAHFFE